MEDLNSKYQLAAANLFKDAREKKYPKNQLIHYEGDPLTNIYYIKEGYIKAYTILDSGDTRTILILGPGDIFPIAFSASMDWDNYHIRYFYQTLCELKLMSIPAAELRREIENNSEMMSSYMQYLSASNEAIMRQLEVMKNKKAIDKVSMLLPYLVSKAGKRVKPDVYDMQLKLSHQEIADLSGVTRETTTTLIKELEKNGILDQKKGHWRINLAKLNS